MIKGATTCFPSYFSQASLFPLREKEFQHLSFSLNIAIEGKGELLNATASKGYILGWEIDLRSFPLIKL